MSKNSVKESFLKKLSLFLSFHFNEEESEDILNDYQDWFKNESLQGKSEEDICLALESPQKIVKNIVSESGSSSSRISILSRNAAVRVFALIAIQWGIIFFASEISNSNSFDYLYFALFFNFLCFLIGFFIIKKASCDKLYNFKWNLPITGLTMLFVLFELLFLPKFHHPLSGKICEYVLGFVLMSAFAASLYLVVQKAFHREPFDLLTLLHISGAGTLLFFLMNQFHGFYHSETEYANLLYGSIALYAETVILCFAFYIGRMRGKE